MKKKIDFLLITCCFLAIQITGLWAKDPSPEQLVAEHLKSVGESSALSQVRSISFIGTSEVNFILPIVGQLSGPARLVSEGPQIGIIMEFGAYNYRAEHFAYDGKSVTVGNIQPGLKSPLGEFIFTYKKIIKNGMLGGVLSRAWPLFDLKNNKPRSMKVRTTKVDGIEMYELEYRPREDHGDMKIRMYFDPKTYRHMRTEYKTSNNNVDGSFYYNILIEKFDDFRQVGLLTLPRSYTLSYTVEGTQRGAFIGNWKIEAKGIVLDASDIDTKDFRAEQ